MTSTFPKKAIIFLFSTALCLQCVSGQMILAEDNFDSYSTGKLSAGAFPSASPSGGTWQTILNNGTLDIVAAPTGRMGNVLQVTDVQTGALSPFPNISLSPAIPTYIGVNPWELNVDFRVETPPSTNFQGPTLLRLEGTNGPIGRVSFFRNDSVTDLTVFSHTFGSGNSQFVAELGNETWHTLTLVGDNTTGTISASVNGGAASILTYGNASTGLSEIVFGDSDSRESSSVVLFDNFSLIAIPEPVFPILRPLETITTGLAPFEQLSEAALVAAVPERSGIVFIASPATDRGAGEWNLFDWAGPSDPKGIICKNSGVRFPNDEFPMTEVLEFSDGQGRPQEASFFLMPDGSGAFFGLHADYLAKIGMAEAAQLYAESWRLSGNVEHARRAALILIRFAEVFPGYIPWQTHPGITLPRADLLLPVEGSHGTWNVSFWKIWSYQSIPDELLRAFDSLRGAGTLSTEQEAQIVANVFDTSLGVQLGFIDRMTNADPHTYQSLILAGRILNRPELVELSTDRIIRFVESNFFYDGVWKEGAPSYHAMAVGHLKKALSFLEDTQLEQMSEVEPVMNKVDRAYLLMTGPDGRNVRVGDDWGYEVTDALMPEGVTVLGGVGHARLAHGAGRERSETHLNFSGGYGHDHAAPLTLTLYGGGREWLPDLGYSWTFLRAFTTGTMSHNTVMVDEQNALWRADTPPGSVTLVTSNPTSSLAIEVDQSQDYPGVTDYRRRVVQVPFGSEGLAYTVDIFSVEGGTRHDYFLHGYADGPSRAEACLEFSSSGANLAGMPESVWPSSASDFRLHEENFFSLFRDPRVADTEGIFSVDWFAEAETEPGLRTWAFAGAERSVVMGETPQVRPSNQDDGTVRDFWRPSLIIRSVPDDERTVFVAVHEPSPEIIGIRKVDLIEEDEESGLIVLRVQHSEGIDWIISATSSVLTQINGISVDGRLAVIRGDAEGELISVFQHDCPQVKVGDRLFEAPESIQVPVVRVEANRMVVEGTESLGDLLFAGMWFTVQMGNHVVHTYQIEDFAVEGGEIVLTTSTGAGFKLENGGATETGFPSRVFRDSPIASFVFERYTQIN